MSLGLGTLGGQALATVTPDGSAPPGSARFGDAVRTRREEILDHPRGFSSPGIQGPNVQPPDRKSFIFTVQELPALHPRGYWNAGVQGPDVRSPTRDFIATVQEVPYHPIGRFYPGRQGPDVRQPVADFIRTTQEYPLNHPVGFQGRGGNLPTPNDYIIIVTIH